MTFKATIDQKVTVWQRNEITFSAENETQAREILNGGRLPADTDFLDTETLYDTEHTMTPAENKGQPTFEIIELNPA